MMNHFMFHKLVVPSFGDGGDAFHGRQCKIPFAKASGEFTRPFNLFCDRATVFPVYENISRNVSTYDILEPGMILFKHYLGLKDQVDIVNICHKWGMGPGGFYQPSYKNGAKLRLHMMCFGRNWDPKTGYKKRYRIDGSEPPPLPCELISLAETVVSDAQAYINELPTMHPDICRVNFLYKCYGRLNLHQDCDESSDSLNRGLPVVYISIGEMTEFVYGDSRDKKKLKSVWLDSGDVLVFGGKSRLIYNGVTQVCQYTASNLLQEVAIVPGHLSLTLRQY